MAVKVEVLYSEALLEDTRMTGLPVATTNAPRMHLLPLHAAATARQRWPPSRQTVV